MTAGLRNLLLLVLFCSAEAARSAEPSPQILTEQNTLPALHTLLARAVRRIDVLQSSFAIDDGRFGVLFTGAPYRLAKELIDRKAASPALVIRLFLAEDGDQGAANRLTGEHLARFGIEVVYGTTHANALAIDDDVVLLGSTTLTEQSLGNNLEADVLLDGYPLVAAGFRRYFEALWRGTKRPHRPTRKDRGVRLLPDGVYKEELIAAFARATKTIDFSVATLNDTALERALLAAQRRGVAVRQRLEIPDNGSQGKFAVVDGDTVYVGTSDWNANEAGEHRQLYVRIDGGATCAQQLLEKAF